MTVAKNGKLTRKNNKIVCVAYGYGGDPCNRYVECDNCKENNCNCGKSQIYCETHLYFKNFTPQQIESIKNKDASMYVCKSCRCWRNIAECEGCVKKRGKDKHREIKRAARIECDVVKQDGVKCSNESEKIVNNKNICKKHAVKKITDLVFWSEKNSSRQCSGCKRFLHPMKYEGEKITCIDCNNRSKEIKKEIKEKPKVMCRFEECEFEAIINKMSDPPTKEEINQIAEKNKLSEAYPEFCGKHQVQAWVVSIDDDKKPCKEWIRGCRKILETNDKSRCKECLDKHNQQDKERRDKEREGIKSKKTENTKICLYCPKEKNIHPIDEYKVGDQEYAMCISCRVKSREQDEKRKNRKRNWKQELENNPERKAKKEQWKKDNIEKVKEYWKLSRNNKKEKMGLDEYLKIAAQQQKKWREANPEKWKEINERIKRNPERRYWIYKNSAKVRNIDFELSFDKCKEMFDGVCYLCDGKNNDGLLCGIDRLDNSIGYCEDNCKPCCTMCNMMKSTYTDTCLIQKIEHVLNTVGIIETGNYYPDNFLNHKSMSLKDYYDRAISKNLNFNIDLDEYFAITASGCYLCEKQSDGWNVNGIDRIDNSDGYYIGNVLPCCYECNCMKNKYDIYELLYKQYLIFIKNNKLEQTYSQNDVIDIVKKYLDEKKKELENDVDEIYAIANENIDTETDEDEDKNEDKDKDKTKFAVAKKNTEKKWWKNMEIKNIKKLTDFRKK